MNVKERYPVSTSSYVKETPVMAAVSGGPAMKEKKVEEIAEAEKVEEEEEEEEEEGEEEKVKKMKKNIELAMC